MKKIIKFFSCAMLLLPLWALAQSCGEIKDKDKSNYCRAVDGNDKAYCQKITNNDLQNLCMAKVENDMKYCRRITTDKVKKRCENSIR